MKTDNLTVQDVIKIYDKFYKDNLDLIRNECFKIKNKSVLDELYNED